jgi:uncharacterized protein
MLGERIGSAELRELAGQRKRRNVRVDPAKMPRLAKILVQGLSVADQSLDGFIDFGLSPEKFPAIRARVSGPIEVLCQRCLRPMRRDVGLDFRLTVVASDDEAMLLTEPFDCVVMEPEGLSLLTVIEDEIFADLPMAPMHNVAAECGRPDVEHPDPEERPERPNRPFESLAVLMDRDGKEQTD